MRIALRGLTLLLLWTPALLAAEKRRVTVDDLMKVKNILDVKMAPDGTEVLYVLSVLDAEQGKYNSDVWVVAVKDGKSLQLTRGTGRDDTPRWSPDGKSIAFLSDRGGKAQVWVMARAGGEPRKLTDSPTAVTDHAWSPDGKTIAFLAADAETEQEKQLKKDRGDVIVVEKNQKRSYIHLIEIGSGKSRALTSGEFHVTSFSWSPDGKRIVFAAQPSPRFEDGKHSDIHLVTLADGMTTPLVKRPGADTAPKFSPDGKYVAFLSKDASDDQLESVFLCLISASGGASRKLTNTDADISSSPAGFEWNSDSKMLFFLVDSGLMRRLSYVDIQGDHLVMFGDASTLVEQFSITQHGLTVLREAATSPRELFVMGEAAPKGMVLTGVRLPSVNPQVTELAFGEVEEIRWKSKDGLEIEGLLVKPVGYQKGKRYPLLTYVHGGPASKFVRGFTVYPSTVPQASRYPVQVFAGQGYAVFCPNPRGSAAYGKKFRQMNVRDWGGKDFEDILTGVDHLIAQGIADPDRLGIMGWSYGGYMTAWAITQTNRFKAASFGAGLTNLTSFYGQTDIPSFLERYWGGPPWEQKELMEKRSAMTFIKNVKTPTLIQHGEKDERVPLAQSQELYAGLKKLGVPVEFVVYPRQGHNVLEPRLQRDVLTRNLEWFNRWLKP